MLREPRLVGVGVVTVQPLGEAAEVGKREAERIGPGGKVTSEFGPPGQPDVARGTPVQQPPEAR